MLGFFTNQEIFYAETQRMNTIANIIADYFNNVQYGDYILNKQKKQYLDFGKNGKKYIVLN